MTTWAALQAHCSEAERNACGAKTSANAPFGCDKESELPIWYAPDIREVSKLLQLPDFQKSAKKNHDLVGPNQGRFSA